MSGGTGRESPVFVCLRSCRHLPLLLRRPPLRGGVSGPLVSIGVPVIVFASSPLVRPVEPLLEAARVVD